MKYQINDIELNVRDQGQGENALLFLHYWGGSSRTWCEVIERLENDFRCIAYDHRGWGTPGNVTQIRWETYPRSDDGVNAERGLDAPG